MYRGTGQIRELIAPFCVVCFSLSFGKLRRPLATLVSFLSDAAGKVNFQGFPGPYKKYYLVTYLRTLITYVFFYAFYSD